MISDHEPVTINKFNGLWKRGSDDSCPPDHFRDGENYQFLSSDDGFRTRDGITTYQSVAAPLTDVKRVYNFVTNDQNTLLILTTGGKIYHSVGATLHGPILTIPTMDDFAFVPFAGRAYISPFKSFGVSPDIIEKGLQNEFVYIYKGDGSQARKAGGNPPTGTLTVANGAAGNTDAGLHVFGVVYETDTGYLTKPAAFTTFTTGASLSVSFSTVPVSPDAFVTKRHIVASKVITNYNNDPTGFQLFFIPNATINDNVTTTLNNISFFDADLLEDASHLLDNFTSLAAGSCLGLYKGRLCIGGQFADPQLIRVSTSGEPEAISEVDGLLTTPKDGNPVNNLQGDMRDVLYARKKNRTISYTDNDDVPTSWPSDNTDNGIGSPVHGAAAVVDSGATASMDFQIICSYRGVELFNGKYADPELSWKIRDFWSALNRDNFNKIHAVLDTTGKIIYVVLPDGRILVGDYNNGLDPKNIRWTVWRFDFTVLTVALINTNDVIIAG